MNGTMAGGDAELWLESGDSRDGIGVGDGVAAEVDAVDAALPSRFAFCLR